MSLSKLLRLSPESIASAASAAASAAALGARQTQAPIQDAGNQGRGGRVQTTDPRKLEREQARDRERNHPVTKILQESSRESTSCVSLRKSMTEAELEELGISKAPLDSNLGFYWSRNIKTYSFLCCPCLQEFGGQLKALEKAFDVIHDRATDFKKSGAAENDPQVLKMRDFLGEKAGY